MLIRSRTPIQRPSEPTGHVPATLQQQSAMGQLDSFAWVHNVNFQGIPIFCVTMMLITLSFFLVAQPNSPNKSNDTTGTLPSTRGTSRSPNSSPRPMRTDFDHTGKMTDPPSKPTLMKTKAAAQTINMSKRHSKTVPDETIDCRDLGVPSGTSTFESHRAAFQNLDNHTLCQLQSLSLKKLNNIQASISRPTSSTPNEALQDLITVRNGEINISILYSVHFKSCPHAY